MAESLQVLSSGRLFQWPLRQSARHDVRRKRKIQETIDVCSCRPKAFFHSMRFEAIDRNRTPNQRVRGLTNRQAFLVQFVRSSRS